MKRQRGRGRKPGGGGGSHSNHGNHGNRSLESNGPEVKIRGTAAQIYEKYAQYARDAQSGGDRVKYETYLQHAEHYFRVMMATMPRDRLFQQQEGGAPMQAQGGEGQPQSAEGNPAAGAEAGAADPLKVMDDQGEDDGDYDDNDNSDDNSSDSGSDRDEVEASDRDSNQSGDRQGKRRRRGRRNRHPDGDRGDNNGGDNNGGGSALDSLARKQGALAGG